ncbi:hypothetical protein [Ruicaihuangia caeni]|uniref:Uncharacterized protein n=1 Tax=Ruicaihuangia caeni TaxID=3042517 RepID=A0AAW6T9N1_9MICO|nr:hypothetical protein [Klugiella sp. YN-L-19]MDI2098738.1 hypothetical protein [Klugiella sp. YN-L-19]
MSWRPLSIVPVWVAVAAAVVIWAVLAPASLYPLAIVLTLGISVLVVFAAQLALQQQEGFVRRTALAISGCVVMLAIASAVLLPGSGLG